MFARRKIKAGRVRDCGEQERWDTDDTVTAGKEEGGLDKSASLVFFFSAFHIPTVQFIIVLRLRLRCSWPARVISDRGDGNLTEA